MLINMTLDTSLLPSLVWFARVVRHRSFTKAAAEFDVSRVAVSLHIKSLEEKLQVRLLHRTTRDMSLTDDGLRLWSSIQPALQAIEQAVVQMNDARDEPSGVIRLNSSRVAARTLVEPHLAEFLALYPQLTVEIVLDDGFSNIIADGMDAGIRRGESVAEHMVAVPISPPLGFAVVGSPAYFANHKRPKTPADLAQHNCVRYRFASAGALLHWSFTDPKTKHDFTVEQQGNTIVNDDLAMLNAAVNGVGLVQHLDLAVQQQLRDGTLVRVLANWCPPMAGFYLYIPTREQMPRKVRALMDFLVAKRVTA